MDDWITPGAVTAAAARIKDDVLRTPTVFSPGLSEALGRSVHLKLENLQIGGSFKARGVLNKFAALDSTSSQVKFVAVSGGNFGIAISEAARAAGADITVVMPRSAPSSSADRIRASGAMLILEPDVRSAFARADALAADGYEVIDDCRDTLVAEGHGTLALELLEDCPSLTDVFIAIGGGAMLAGAATIAKAMKPEIRIWGVETAGASSMHQALRAGKPIEVEIRSIVSTLGVPVIDQKMLCHARRYVEDVIIVSDNDAIDGMIQFGEVAKQWVELASGTLIPAAAAAIPRLPDDAVVGLVVCGGNISHADMNRWSEHRTSRA
ncbi:threonine ammonia-lyase [Rhodovulum sulfidophilum]|uniref:threonine ammonia-lyase n=1 Tax=Rhodovulum sulfidophilum TaxID=35806 RepID=UPI00095165C2|nr:pyridoxal-phosphate dependent enzyme [Rhodovulum sulfidophilum]MBL3554407.1 pyridoxal-phosphate dependent enzyme [Rhodovulum sulfidophilum]MBL3566756.1 pyridoxal-phosphate dependent enzyme [Rhodovulum sulfidophilum]OLS48911.1 serine dehydratase [Rhodovulum sulfidophilum]